MNLERLRILFLSQMPASPPRFGAQARMHGLMTELGRRHDLTAVMLVDQEFDLEECRRAMLTYCSKVVLVPYPHSPEGLAKRLLQLRSLASTHSFERIRVMVPALQQAIDRVLRSTRFDVVNLEFPYLGHCDLRQSPPGTKHPIVVVDSHEIAFDLARQFARTGSNFGRRLYAGINWRKLEREELRAYREADGVYLCSAVDQQRLLALLPQIRTAVIPNAADVDYYQPRSMDPSADGRTVMYFGLLSTIPNLNAVTHFVRDIWPRIHRAHPGAHCKIVGGRAPESLLALAGPSIELTGFVPDLRPHLAAASVVVVPLRQGGGTRLKIVEAMAMGKAVVSTTIGAEGIAAVPGRDILIEDDASDFADAVSRLLAEPELAKQIGQSARQLSVKHYSWNEAAQVLEAFYRQLLEYAS